MPGNWYGLSSYPGDINCDLPAPPGKMRRSISPPSLPTAPPSAAAISSTRDDLGEDRLIADFGPGGRMRGSAQGSITSNGITATLGEYYAMGEEVVINAYGRFDPGMLLDRQVVNQQGFLRRVIYDPTCIARELQPISRTGREGCSFDKDCSAAAIDRLASTLEMALDPRRPGRESLLICKAVTDAYLVNARHLGKCGMIAGGRVPKYNYFLRALGVAWQHAVEHWDPDGPNSAVDLHLTASWFQAWSAADDTNGGGEPIIKTHGLEDMLPGDWVWVLDHLEIAGAPEGLHLDEELELERLEERKLRLPREEWGLDCLQYALRNVSNEKWFRGGGGMIDLKIAGPHRQSTFRRVFSNVPGAVYGCLKDRTGAGSTPPTFRMYTTGDLFEALGERVMLRHRDAAQSEEVEGGETVSTPRPGTQRQVVSLVEMQVTWVGGYTHLLGWLDSTDG